MKQLFASVCIGLAAFVLTLIFSHNGIAAVLVGIVTGGLLFWILALAWAMHEADKCAGGYFHEHYTKH